MPTPTKFPVTANPAVIEPLISTSWTACDPVTCPWL